MENHDHTNSSPASSELSSDHRDRLCAELYSLRRSRDDLLSKSIATEQALTVLRARNAEISRENGRLLERVQELEASKRNEEDESGAKMEGLRIEADIYRERIGEIETERERGNAVLAKCLESLNRIIENIKEEEEEEEEETIISDSVTEIISRESELTRVVLKLEEKVNSYRESRDKEKKELENSVVSLTEENRDINSLLRVALLEKESVEKKRLKGSSVAILQRVGFGFGFMMGSGTSEISSDSSDTEKEVVTLASTVERIMKNLRLEITQLKRSLEESRSESERLQSLSEKQAQNIAENIIYIKELEDRERVLTQHVDELLTTIRETEAEVARWREACELEVEAAKIEIGERDKVVSILKQELERTKTLLDVSNGKVKLKQELVVAAMAAQAAAERSLELADSRATGLRARIEDLSKQLEEAETREWRKRKIRYFCWPWRAFRANTKLPEMQAFLHYHV